MVSLTADPESSFGVLMIWPHLDAVIALDCMWYNISVLVVLGFATDRRYEYYQPLQLMEIFDNAILATIKLSE